ncbi:MAG TPA: cytochrome bc complex cytochrome b subunit [Acidimicrobiales bacterium]|nr:cytochrome bc complex cytochrome b subunit [Acidimicrobiales bacterium]
MSTTAPTTTTNGSANGKTAKASTPVDGAVRWLDDRLGIAKGGRTLLDKIFPDHWSFLLGEIALYSFVILLATGVFLSLYFVPSSATVIYHGAYVPLRGAKMSAAYASSLDLSFAVRSGLVIRQMHHWAADVFVGAIAVHMARIYFTGAFRKPRELNWFIGITLLMLAIVEGFLGYSLPDDLVSGTGIRIAYSIILSIPVVGSYLATFVFGGNFPGNGLIIPRFFILHVLIVPLVLLGLIGGHLGLLVRQKHTQFPGHGRTEDNVVGTPMYPTFILKTTGFLFMVAGVLWALGGLAQINPIWQFGPYEATRISYAVQPDWYMGWLDGALRIMPSWEFTGFGHTIPFVVFLPAVLFPGLTFNLFYLWPFIESRVTGNRKAHNLLERPRDRPLHTAVGAAGLAFYFMLFSASSTDVLANFFQISLNSVLWFFRFAVFVIPIVVGLATWQICRDMAGVSGIGKRKRAVVVTRSAAGEYATHAAEPRPGDGLEELAPTPVPTFVEPAPEPVGAAGEGQGVRRIAREI